jgi:lysophospholipase L1-like esterase
MKTRIVIFIYLISFLVNCGGFRGKIVCFGDSITYGALVEGNGWVDQLALMSDKITLVNAGRKGRKTADIDELPPVIEANKDADYFIFFLGVNDLKDGNDSLVYNCADNIRTMIDMAAAGIENVHIILVAPCGINLETMSDLNKGKKYNGNTAESLIMLEEKYRAIAKEKNTGFISLLTVVSPGNYVDGLHPNIEGHKQIADKIWEFLSS